MREKVTFTMSQAVDILESIRLEHKVPATLELVHNSRSSFHKENYLKELKRMEEEKELQLRGIRQMQNFIGRLR